VSEADRLAATLLARCAFDPSTTHVDLAVSGGADSLALLCLAVARGLEVTVHHVDHALRDDSARDAPIVERAAQRFGASFVAHRVEVGEGPNLEARARAARFAVLPATVATGHSADDQAETILLNVLRGAALDGLAAMRPGPRHPLLRLRRRELAELVAANGLEVAHDPSNDDPRFARNRVRHELLPLASEIARRDLVPILCRQADLLADERDLLEELAASVDPTAVAALRAAPIALQRRALRRWLRGPQGHPLESGALERLLALVAGSAAATHLPGGARVHRSRGRLHLR
jgi:tRNA(Ile)-lysidine synthase